MDEKTFGKLLEKLRKIEISKWVQAHLGFSTYLGRFKVIIGLDSEKRGDGAGFYEDFDYNFLKVFDKEGEIYFARDDSRLKNLYDGVYSKLENIEKEKAKRKQTDSMNDLTSLLD